MRKTIIALSTEAQCLYVIFIIYTFIRMPNFVYLICLCWRARLALLMFDGRCNNHSINICSHFGSILRVQQPDCVHNCIDCYLLNSRHSNDVTSVYSDGVLSTSVKMDCRREDNRTLVSWLIWAPLTQSPPVCLLDMGCRVIDTPGLFENSMFYLWRQLTRKLNSMKSETHLCTWIAIHVSKRCKWFWSLPLPVINR